MSNFVFDQGLGTRLFASFSLKRNINSWLNTNASSELSAVSGILFLSVAWIILSHSWEIPFLSYSYPFQEIRDLAPRPVRAVIIIIVF